VSPVFLRYLHAFGSKTKGEDENFNGYHYMPFADGPTGGSIHASYGAMCASPSILKADRIRTLLYGSVCSEQRSAVRGPMVYTADSSLREI